MKKNSKYLAQHLAQEILKKKGKEIIILDLRKMSPITDFFVIATGLSDIHIKNVMQTLIDFEKPHHVEGHESAHWILLDYVDVIVHLFLKDIREFYGLERLWGDAPTIRIEDD
ncbi:MAG: ribosome silencing factor [candidate division WOR-3 bacterium]